MVESCSKPKVSDDVPESPPLTEEEKEAVRRYRAGDGETVTFKNAEEAIRWLHE